MRRESQITNVASRDKKCLKDSDRKNSLAL